MRSRHDFFPASFGFGNCARTFPWAACARFAAGVGQLHSGYASLFMNKTDDSTQHFDVPVGPDAEILRADASLGKNGVASVMTSPAPPTARLPR